MSEPGFCQCGCGAPTRIAPVNDRSKGWTKGVPVNFVKGHSTAKASRAKSEGALGNRSAQNGYIAICVGPNERQYEHILIAERALGRALQSLGRGHPDSEVVHHIDGDKTNNAPSNLLICTHQYHTALHHRLAASSDWPEFQPVRRVGFGGDRKLP